jgi:tetratricopeptide (TPR) repeat protein
LKSDTPKAVLAMLDQAFGELQSGAYQRAIDTFTACLVVSPREADAFRGRGTARFELKNWDAAKSDFQKAKEINPDDPENWIGLGMSLAMDLKLHPAVEVMEASLEKHPAYLRGYLMLGLLLVRIGAIEKGKSFLQQALNLGPSHQERRLIETQLLMQAGGDTPSHDQRSSGLAF